MTRDIFDLYNVVGFFDSAVLGNLERFDFSERTARRAVKIGQIEKKLGLNHNEFNDWWRETRDKFNGDKPYMVAPIVDFVDYAAACADDYLINRDWYKLA